MTRKVLIVDDNAIAAMDIEAEVETFGFEVIIASDPKRALQVARLAEFVVAFIDVSLREAFDGLEVARALAKDTGAKVVILTGHSEAELAGRMDGIGSVLVLSKPIDYPALRAFLQSVANSAAA